MTEEKMKRLIFQRWFEIVLIVLPLIVTREWFFPGMPQTHDAEVHISRAAMMATSIREGNILPRWGGYFNWGYGTPSIMFLYPGLPYAAAVVHLLTGLTFIPIYKLFMIAPYVGSGIAWFRWMRLLSLSPIASFVGALFYLLAPYRLVNIFVRGALAEHLGFFLFPLLMIASTQVLKKSNKKNFLFLSLIVSIQILTHNLSALLYFPIITVFPFLAQKISSLPRFSIPALFRYYGAIAVGFLLTGFFWIPALVESKYTLASWMFTNRDWYADHFLAFQQLVWSRWGYGWSLPGVEQDGMTFQVGIAQWTVLLVMALLILRKKLLSRFFHFSLYAYLLTLIGIFMALPVSNFAWHLSSLLPKFQFPWRFLSYIVIGTSLLGGLVTETLKKHRAFLAVLVVLPIVTTIPYWRIAGPSSLTEQFLTVDYVGTSDTGETTPVWAIRFQEKKAKAPVEVVSAPDRDFVEIIPGKRLQERHMFRVVAKGSARLVDNTLYFPGWTVYVDGNKTPIEFHDENWRGLITFPIEPGTHDVVVIFEETLLRKVSNAISLVTAAFLAYMFLRRESRDYGHPGTE